MRLAIDILILIGCVCVLDLVRKIRDWREGRP